jgi:hypothetical protein
MTALAPFAMFLILEPVIDRASNLEVRACVQHGEGR